jgi:hypothetical protein
MKLIQKQGFNKKEFELIDDTLLIKTKTHGDYKEWTVRVENIGDTKYYQSGTKLGVNIVGGFFALFVLFVIIAFILDKHKAENLWTMIGIVAIFGSFSTLFLLIPKKRELHIIGGSTQITFFPDSPNKEEVDIFVNELICRSKKILLDKYGMVDPDLPEETQMNQLNWLKNRNLIENDKPPSQKVVMFV